MAADQINCLLYSTSHLFVLDALLCHELIFELVQESSEQMSHRHERNVALVRFLRYPFLLSFDKSHRFEQAWVPTRRRT